MVNASNSGVCKSRQTPSWQAPGTRNRCSRSSGAIPQRVAAPVRLRTAIGTERALRVERIRTDGSGRVTKLWFARERGWLPLRIKQYERDGETIDMRITAIR